MAEIWDLWFPRAGATGLPFARCKIGEPVRRLLVHAAPPELDVAVRDEDGRLLAQGAGLRRGESGPMTFLVRDGGTISLEDGWPSDEDIGCVVVLPGGEAGILKAWWHAPDRSEWRWQVEFYNHR